MAYFVTFVLIVVILPLPPALALSAPFAVNILI
jgi:hypothetical protein